jgi:hypothetical protein
VFDELVARQHGLITRQQVLACGLTDNQIREHMRRGRWRRLVGRVYATFMGPLSRQAQIWAAVLRAGRGAVVSHETAAELAGLIPVGSPAVHVTVPGNRRVKAVDGMVVHHSTDVDLKRHPTLLPPRTRIEETVIDLTQRARTLNEALGWLVRACDSRLTTPERIGEALDGRQRLRWRPALNRALFNIAEGRPVHLRLPSTTVDRDAEEPREPREEGARRG